jgi:poly-beta-1,6-N-acetyl-D-glucosamine synthase
MKQGQLARYVIITPVKDEAAYITEALRSVSAQTVKPCRWILVDDCSKDATASIIRKFMKEQNWIQLVSLDRESERYPGSPVVNAFTHGLKALAEQEYDYIVKLDADLRFGQEYFSKLIENFQQDERLGIASGVYLEASGDKWETVRMPAYHAAGASKFIRRECFLQIGGFIPTLGWDTIDEIRALAHGWRSTHFTDIPFYHLKKEGTGIGRMRTSEVHGRIFYLTGGKPCFFVVKAINRMIWGRPPIIGGMLMTLGYCKAAFR